MSEKQKTKTEDYRMTSFQEKEELIYFVVCWVGDSVIPKVFLSVKDCDNLRWMNSCN